jgi:hypothetical protein
MSQTLPGPRPCAMCSSKSYDGTVVLIQPRAGRIRLSSREIDAAVYDCTLCGAVREEPLRTPRAA